MTDPDTSFDREPPAPRRRWRLWLATLIVAALLIAGGAWTLRERMAVESDAVVALRNEIDSLRATQRASETARAALERRVAATEGVNRSMREDLLGAGERTSALEDAVARLARRGLGGSTEFRLNEAEFLLSMGVERLVLFGDVVGTLRALDLADSELEALDDPIYAGVRQSLALEREALRAVPQADTTALFAELDAVSALVSGLPLAPVSRLEPGLDIAADPDAGLVDRLRRGFGRFIRVERRDAGPSSVRDPEHQRRIVEVELLRAKSALALGDRAAMAIAAARARAALGPAPEGDAEHAAVFARLDALAESRALSLPSVGAALEQLRNLRMTRSLVAPTSDEGSPP
jgi:uroporphyrin-3 C-methyltransferase